MDCYDLEASLVYTVNSKPARATFCLKNNKKSTQPTNQQENLQRSTQAVYFHISILQGGHSLFKYLSPEGHLGFQFLALPHIHMQVSV